MKKKYNLISFSGIDSSGKSTYIKYLVNEFEQQRIKYKVIWSRGGYTSGFETLKNFLRLILGKRLPQSGVSEKRTKMLSSKKISYVWYTIAMIDLIRLYVITFRIYKILGYTIICDRYIWDTYVDFALMGYSGILNKRLWIFLERTYLKPEYSFCFTISPDESLARSNYKKEPFSENIESRKERLKLYQLLIETKKWDSVIDTEKQPIDEAWSIIKNTLS